MNFNNVWGYITAGALIIRAVAEANPGLLPEWASALVLAIAGGTTAQAFRRSVDYKDMRQDALKPSAQDRDATK